MFNIVFVFNVVCSVLSDKESIRDQQSSIYIARWTMEHSAKRTVCGEGRSKSQEGNIRSGQSTQYTVGLFKGSLMPCNTVHFLSDPYCATTDDPRAEETER